MNTVVPSTFTLEETEPAAVPEIPTPDDSESKFSASIQANYTALQNDLEQARNLAADYQRQLAGKSNDCAEMRRILEKTETDLDHLKRIILELRQERHRLANEVVKIPVLEHRLKRMTEERDHLRVERTALWIQAAEHAGKEPAAQPEAAAPMSGPIQGNDRIRARRLIAELLESVEDLKEIVEPSQEDKCQAGAHPDCIVEVSFGG